MLIQPVLSIVELILLSMKKDGRNQQKIQIRNMPIGMPQIGKTKQIVKLQIGIDLLLRHYLHLIILRNHLLLYLILTSLIISKFLRLQYLRASKKSKRPTKNLQDYYIQRHGNIISHSLEKKEVKNSNMYLIHMKP